MGQPVFLADPAIAAAYHVPPGQWAWIEDDAEAEALIAQHFGYGIGGPSPPAAHFVHPAAKTFPGRAGLLAPAQPPPGNQPAPPPPPAPDCA